MPWVDVWAMNLAERRSFGMTYWSFSTGYASIASFWKWRRSEDRRGLNVFILAIGFLNIFFYKKKKGINSFSSRKRVYTHTRAPPQTCCKREFSVELHETIFFSLFSLGCFRLLFFFFFLSCFHRNDGSCSFQYTLCLSFTLLLTRHGVMRRAMFTTYHSFYRYFIKCMWYIIN